jgi:hypothetical protein
VHCSIAGAEDRGLACGPHQKVDRALQQSRDFHLPLANCEEDAMPGELESVANDFVAMKTTPSMSRPRPQSCFAG